ncbi:MAG: DUF3987 domain-containing protein [Anaerolineaceae bacterium]|nr:MAG: DUF3987 domain-containing protein [Anaerolineaceae bacterium]
MTTITKTKSAPAETRAPVVTGSHRNDHDADYTPALDWFAKQGARFVRVAAWKAKVNAPGKQPIEMGWQEKPLTAKDVLAHLRTGGNVGLLCGKHSGGLCLLDVDDHLQEFLEYFPGLASVPIIQRRDAPNRGKIVLKLTGAIPANKKWHDHHLEFLGTGNQGVIPPSIHPEGAPYELRNADRAALDYDGARIFKICEAWMNRNAPEKNHDLNPPTVGRGRLSRQTRDFLSYGAGPETRNNRLFVAACDLYGCNYPQAEAEAMLLPIWLGMGKPEKEAHSTITSAYSQPRTPANPHAFDNVVTSKPALVVTGEETKGESTEDEPADFPITSNMPELPKVARLDPTLEKNAKKAGKFIGDYTSFAMRAAPMTPPLFHQTFALAILSTAIARRVYVRGGTDAIYPNLYILLSARSTLYTKTTGYNAALKVLEAAGLSHLNLPDGMTPQSLMTELSNRAQDNFTSWDKEEQDDWKQERLFAGQRAWWVDEAARLLAQLQQKHLAELGDIMLKLYECPTKIKVSTQMRGRETVRNAYLTICGPTTPAALRPHLKNSTYWGNGLFSRFLLVSPDTAPVRVFYPEPFAMPASLPKHINQLAFDRLELPKESALGPTPAPPAVEAKLGRDVRQMWDNYHAAMYELIGKKAVAEKLEPWYGRITTNTIKIAMLLAASDWARMAKGNPLEIHPAHWARAQEITEGYRASLHRMVEDASLPIESEDDELAEKIIARVKSGVRNSRRELTQDLHVRAGIQRQRFDIILTQLLEDGVLVEYEVKNARGPSTKRLFYRNP